MKAKVTIYKHKKLKDGTHPLMVILRKGRERKTYSLGVSIQASKWDDKYDTLKKVTPVKVDHPGYKAYQEYKEMLTFILSKQQQYDEMIERLIRMGRPFSFDTLIASVENPPERDITVQKLFLQRIDEFNDREGIGQARTYRDTYLRIDDFQKGRALMFYQADHVWHMQFRKYLYERGMQKGTIFRHLRSMRAIFNLALKRGIAKQDDYPYRLHPEIFEGLKVSYNSQPLSMSEIDQIRSLDLEEGSDLFHARNYFLFMYLGHGHNIGDLARFKWSDISHGRLYYIRYKTRSKVTERGSFKITAEMQRILNWYRAHWKEQRQIHNPYIFPILNGFHQSKKQQANRIHKMTHVINKSLKQIGEKIGSPVKITTYTARHSMANALVQQGVDVVRIKQILRHRSIETTQHYLKQFDNTDIDEAVGLL